LRAVAAACDISASGARKAVLAQGCKLRSLSDSRRIDIAGDRHGRLVAISPLLPYEGVWKWKCDCGRIVEKKMALVRHGVVRSCGCLASDETRKRNLERNYDYFDDSLAAKLLGCFRKEGQGALFYIHALARHRGYYKPGVDSRGDRASRDKEYGAAALLLFFEDRFDAWLLERGVLKATADFRKCPKRIWHAKWSGKSELRRMRKSDIVAISLDLAAQLSSLGRWRFAAVNVATSEAERRACLALSD
jgi:hypothetical protein